MPPEGRSATSQAGHIVSAYAGKPKSLYLALAKPLRLQASKELRSTIHGSVCGSDRLVSFSTLANVAATMIGKATVASA